MAASGMAMMLKSLGLDPDELKSNVEAFMVHMKAQAEKINANQARLERGQTDAENRLERLHDKIEDLQNTVSAIHLLIVPQTSTTHILENGQPSGVLVTSEKFPQEMIDDVLNTPETTGQANNSTTPTANFYAEMTGGQTHGGRERSNNEE